MKTTDSIGRRSFVRGTVLALAAGAIPATAAAITVSALPGLITAHKATVKARDEALAEVQRIEALPDYPDYPRVQTGNLVTNKPGAPYYLQPLYSYSVEGIEEAADLKLQHFVFDRYENPYARYCEWIDKKTAEFEADKARFKAEAIAIGAVEAEEAYDDACEAEEEARIALIAYRPSTAEEAATKLRYLSIAEPSAGALFAQRPDLIDRLMERLNEPAVQATV